MYSKLLQKQIILDNLLQNYLFFVNFFSLKCKACDRKYSFELLCDREWMMFRVKKWRDDVNPIGASPVPTFLLMNIVPLHEKGRHSEAFPWFESQIPNVPPSIFSLSNSFSMRLLTLISNLFRLSPLPDPRFQECTLTRVSNWSSLDLSSYFSFIRIYIYRRI